MTKNKIRILVLFLNALYLLLETDEQKKLLVAISEYVQELEGVLHNV